MIFLGIISFYWWFKYLWKKNLRSLFHFTVCNHSFRLFYVTPTAFWTFEKVLSFHHIDGCLKPFSFSFLWTSLYYASNWALLFLSCFCSDGSLFRRILCLINSVSQSSQLLTARIPGGSSLKKPFGVLMEKLERQKFSLAQLMLVSLDNEACQL